MKKQWDTIGEAFSIAFRILVCIWICVILAVLWGSGKFDSVFDGYLDNAKSLVNQVFEPSPYEKCITRYYDSMIESKTFSGTSLIQTKKIAAYRCRSRIMDRGDLELCIETIAKGFIEDGHSKGEAERLGDH